MDKNDIKVLGKFMEIENAKSKVDGKGAGIVMIGPVPIIFGTDSGSVKTVILMIVFLLFSRWYV